MAPETVSERVRRDPVLRVLGYLLTGTGIYGALVLLPAVTASPGQAFVHGFWAGWLPLVTVLFAVWCSVQPRRVAKLCGPHCGEVSPDGVMAAFALAGLAGFPVGLVLAALLTGEQGDFAWILQSSLSDSLFLPAVFLALSGVVYNRAWVWPRPRSRDAAEQTGTPSF